MVMLVLLAINSYPFQPRSQLLLLSWLLNAFVAGTAIYIFVKINRDEVLSRMSVGGAGVITWDSSFVASLLVCVAAPILAVLAMQFPEWQDYFSSTGSLLRSFHLK